MAGIDLNRAARTIAWTLLAAAAFHAAYASSYTGVLVLVYLFALVQLAQAERWRKAFYPALGVGLLIAIGRLDFFRSIFSSGAAALWLVYAFWIGLFAALARLSLVHFGPKWGWLPIPFLWTGLEYFRSELYYLRFSWLSPGYALAEGCCQAPLKYLGVYGAGFLLMCIACVAAFLWRHSRLQAMAALVAGAAILWVGGSLPESAPGPERQKAVRIAGIQMEFPSELEVLTRLREVVRQHPETELLVLSEYTFDGPIPQKVRDWCRKSRRYLIAGGRDVTPGTNFYNTTFVVGPEGDIVFEQVKSVPIQFMKDGLAAPVQKVWNSPWGKLGICVCYDLSYSRVTDRLVQLGAEALIVPTMDVIDWGRRQHELHARIAPARAREYGIPIYRVASSGISQHVSHTGRVLGALPCPGEGGVLAGMLELRGPGHRPMDRWLAPAAVFVSLAVTGWLTVQYLRERYSGRRKPVL